MNGDERMDDDSSPNWPRGISVGRRVVSDAPIRVSRRSTSQSGRLFCSSLQETHGDYQPCLFLKLSH